MMIKLLLLFRIIIHDDVIDIDVSGTFALSSSCLPSQISQNIGWLPNVENTLSKRATEVP